MADPSVSVPAEPDHGQLVSQILDTIGDQSELLITLAVAVCAGIVAIFFQTLVHNRSDDNRPIQFAWAWLLILAFFLEGLSILFGYLTKGSLAASIPALYAIDWNFGKSLAHQESVALETIRVLSLLQFAGFMGGIASILVFLAKNLKLIKTT